MSNMLSRVIPGRVKATSGKPTDVPDQDRMHADVPEDVKALLLRWGYTHPNEVVIDAAKDVLATKAMRSGEFMVSRGHFTDDGLATLLKEKPRDVRLLEYIQTIEPGAAQDADRYMAACTDAPYYHLADVEVLRRLPADVIRELDRYDALLVEVCSPGPLTMVFATYAQLSRFRSQGRGERMNSPIHTEMMSGYSGELHLAISYNMGIGQLLRELQATGESEEGIGRYANEWVVGRNNLNVSAVEKDLQRLLDYCLTEDINDISMTPSRTGGYDVAVRRYGDLVAPDRMSSYPTEMATSIKRFLMTQSGANPTQATRIAEPRDGSIAYRSPAGACFLRCSFIPTNHRGDLNNSTSISLRILPLSSQPIDVARLNLPEQIVRDLQLALRLSSGLVLVVGPTNSGKSTTIAGAINEHVTIFGGRRKRLSLEDPIERFIKGVTQFEPSAKEGEEGRFDQMLRAFKRHDPDMMWVGEIRDTETSELCVDAAASGHVVVSTLHANDTVTGVDLLGRLVPTTKTFQLIESTSLVISQRLVKAVCQNCCSSSEPTEEERWLFDRYLDRIGDHAEMPEKVSRANHDGCDRCRGGYDGQLPVCESLPMTRKARDDAMNMIIQRQAGRDTLARHRSLTMLRSVMELVERGLVELETVLT